MMKLNAVIVVSIGITIAAFFGVGCGCCGGGGDVDDFDFGKDYEETEKLKKPDEKATPDIPGTSGLQTQTGYIDGPGLEEEFSIYANKDPLELTFSWDQLLDDPYVKVLGRDRNELGTFRLKDGNVIELTGGGQFYIIVGTYIGFGNWTCTYSQ